MKFLDYTFTLVSESDIIFDNELTANQLNVKDGDKFEVCIIEGMIVFKKLQVSE
jgi:hypothetical protein